MEVEDILASQLAALGFAAASTVADGGAAKLSSDELYGLVVEGLKMLYNITGQAAKDKADGAKRGLLLLPRKLPKSTSSRFSICEALGKELTNFGNDGADNLKAVMYPTEESTKGLLKWLIDGILKAKEDERERQVQASVRSAEDHRLGVVAAGVAQLKGEVESAFRTGSVVVRRPRRELRQPLPYFRTATLMPVSAALTDERISFAASVQAESKKNLTATAAFTYGLYNSVLDLNAVEFTHTTECQSIISTCSAADRDEILTPNSPSLLACPSDLHRAGTTQGATRRNRIDLASLFFDSSDQGLDPEAVESRKREEAEAQAAVNALDESESTATLRGRAREQEAELVAVQLATAKRELASRKAQIKALKSLRQELESEFAAWERDNTAGAKLREERRVALSERSELLSMMEDAEGHITRFEQELTDLAAQKEAARQDFLKRTAKVEVVREKLMEQLAAAGATNDEVVRALRSECKALKAQISVKKTELQVLQGEFERCPKDVDRSKYLRYIFDMTGNLQRQQEEIAKVMKETSATEARIDKLTEEVKSIFETLEGSVYDKATATTAAASTAGGRSSTASTGDGFARDAFKKIVELRTSYVKLVDLIQDRGTLKKETHEADEKLSKLRRLVGQYNLEAVEKDLAAIQLEAERLEEFRRQGSAA